MESAKYRTGVLFVHGIGTQRRGQTLSMYADAMFSWVRDRITGVADGHKLRGTPREMVTQAWGPYSPPASKRQEELLESAHKTADESDERRRNSASSMSIARDLAWHLAFINTEKRLDRAANLGETVRVQPPPNEPLVAMASLCPQPSVRSNEPSAASVDISWVDEDHVRHTSKWLWAESWWAEVFEPPKFAKLLRWTPLALFFTVITHWWSRHEHGPSHPVWRKWLDEIMVILAFLFWFVFVTLGAPLVYAVLASAALVAVLPWKSLQTPFLKIRQLVVGVVGDAFALIEQPLNGAVIREKVSRDLHWLSERCDRVLVVGHSQGALLAYLACCESRPKNAEALITLGSGIRKLHSLMAAAESNEISLALARNLLLAANCFGAVLLGAVTLGATGQLSTGTVWAVGIVSGLAAIITGIGAWAMVFVKALEPHPEDAFWRSRMKSDGFLWIDLYASHDPVPGGDMKELIHVQTKGDDVSPSVPSDYPQSIRITNQACVLGDHWSYLTNREECISALVWYCAFLDRTGSHCWLAPPREAYTAISSARCFIVRRAKRTFRAVGLLVAIVLATRFWSGELPSLVSRYITKQVSIGAVSRSLGLHAADVGLLFVLMSALMAVVSAKMFALQRLGSALLKRKHYFAKNKPGIFPFVPVELTHQFVRQYGSASLGEWLGLFTTAVIPLIVFVAAIRYCGELGAVLWTLLGIGAAWAATAAFRATQRDVSDLRGPGRPKRKTSRSDQLQRTNIQELLALAQYEDEES